jgi:hypothetical protein
MPLRIVSATFGLFLLGIGPAMAQFATHPAAPTQQSTSTDERSPDCSQPVSLCDFGK